MLRIPQSPFAVGSYVYADDNAERLRLLLRSMPFAGLVDRVQLQWAAEAPHVLDALQEIFGERLDQPMRIESDHNDVVRVSYKGRLPAKLPSSVVTVSAVGRFDEAPVLTVAWGSRWKDRDLECDDVMESYVQLALRSRARCSVLGIEQSIVRMEGGFVMPLSYACAVSCESEWAREGDPAFAAMVAKVKRSVRRIAGSPCEAV